MNIRSTAILAALGLLAVTIRSASAGVALDLRVTDINGLPVPNPKSILVVSGDVVTLGLYATVTGAPGNGGLEGFQSFGGGSILTPGGNLHADIILRSFVAPFDAISGQLGAIADLDLDGDLDLGDNSAGPIHPNHIAVQSVFSVTGDPAGLAPAVFHVFTADLLIGSVPDPGAPAGVDVLFRLPNLIGLSTEATWLQDGVLTNTRGAGGGTYINIAQSPPIHIIAVPEPSGALLLAAAGCALLLRRRR